MWPTACSASSRNGPERSKPSSTSPPSRFSITVASSCPRKQELPSWPKWMRSPAATRLPGRTKASQRSGATRMCSVASISAEASPRLRMPVSCAGMTLVSLTTSTSPASSSDGRSCTTRSSNDPCGRTTSSLAASRGVAGRNAMRSSGRSKSKRSTRIR